MKQDGRCLTHDHGTQGNVAIAKQNEFQQGFSQPTSLLNHCYFVMVQASATRLPAPEARPENLTCFNRDKSFSFYSRGWIHKPSVDTTTNKSTCPRQTRTILKQKTGLRVQKCNFFAGNLTGASGVEPYRRFPDT